MRAQSLTFPLLLSFSELAWIAMLFFTMIHRYETTKLVKQRDQMARELAEAQQRLTEFVNSETVIRKQILGLKGELKRVVVVFDSSRSMVEGGRWNHARHVVQTWLEHLLINECALITFSNTPLAFPSDGSLLDLKGPAGQANRIRLIKQLDQVMPRGGTNTLLALKKAYAYQGIDTILLFTDGAPNRGSGGFDEQAAEEIYELCQKQKQGGRHIPINTIGLGTYFNKQLADFLLRVARETGGTFLGQ